jgi:poly(3-hydroxybutyrate) depolymerase
VDPGSLHSLTLVATWGLGLAACLLLSIRTSGADAVSSPDNRHADPYQVTRPGDRLCTYLSPADGTPQPYHVYVPASYDPTRPTPVVFSLHGFGGRTGPAGGGWKGRWADANTWLLVRPDGRGNQNWDGIGEDDIFHILRDLCADTPDHPAFNIDPNRLYADGGSMGGHGAFRLATRHAGTFAATAPVAGWTTYREFYGHWYDAADPPRMGGYVDPARKPLLETASSLQQAENGLRCPMLITFDYNDAVNPPDNALQMLRRIRAAGGVRTGMFGGEAGHCGSYDTRRNFRFFRGHTLDRWPRSVRLATNTLRHNRAHWLTLRRMRILNRRANIEAYVSDQQVEVTTRNVLAFELAICDELLDTGRPVEVRIDGRPPMVLPTRGSLVLKARLNEDLGIEAWEVCADTQTDAIPGVVLKTHTQSGPVDDAFRSRFIVIYGAQPGSRRAAAGTDLRDAQRFAAEWNAWMTLHWGNQRPSHKRRDNWWEPPYPFRPGRHVHPDAVLVTPRPDTDFTLDNLPDDRNLVLFGDPASNWIVAHMADRLPIRVTSTASGGVRAQCGGAAYAGDHVNYLFIAPNPLTPRRYVVLARGYLSSDIDPGRHGARNVGKDLEALPFYWPDYVIWDARREPGRTVQDPLRYLPDTFIEAGYFNERWQLQDAAPAPRVVVEGEQARGGAFFNPVTVKVAAAGIPGGFGLAGTEYRVNDGPWMPYREPLALHASGPVTVAARATHHSGRFVYGDMGGAHRGTPEEGLLSGERVVQLELRGPRTRWERFRQWLR